MVKLLSLMNVYWTLVYRKRLRLMGDSSVTYVGVGGWVGGCQLSRKSVTKVYSSTLLALRGGGSYVRGKRVE